MKQVTYNLRGGGMATVEYDENAPCRICGEPVVEASMGGTDVCPWCDCGICRHCGERHCVCVPNRTPNMEGGRDMDDNKIASTIPLKVKLHLTNGEGVELAEVVWDFYVAANDTLNLSVAAVPAELIVNQEGEVEHGTQH